MRSTKRYSNVTFSRRVDHEGGAHREARALAGPRVCDRCGARYERRRWALPPGAGFRTLDLRPGAGERVLCPGCKRVDSGVPSGYLTLEGAFAMAHADELVALLRNEAAEALADNPTARVIEWERGPRRLRLTTTTVHLAKRLGRAVARACQGEIRYDFSHENQVARVNWRRPAATRRAAR
ncbi:MAG: BCAM0308 family protein [Vicinamibacterales bacterium]